MGVLIAIAALAMACRYRYSHMTMNERRCDIMQRYEWRHFSLVQFFSRNTGRKEASADIKSINQLDRSRCQSSEHLLMCFHVKQT